MLHGYVHEHDRIKNQDISHNYVESVLSDPRSRYLNGVAIQSHIQYWDRSYLKAAREISIPLRARRSDQNGYEDIFTPAR